MWLLNYITMNTEIFMQPAFNNSKKSLFHYRLDDNSSLVY